MLVYANHFKIKGSDAGLVVFKAVQRWMQEKTGLRLPLAQLTKRGEFNGLRNNQRSFLRVIATSESSPAMYAWVLKHPDDRFRGRQWIVELGLKHAEELAEFSCVIKTDEFSALAGRYPVSAKCPRVISHLFDVINKCPNAALARDSTLSLKSIGKNKDCFHDLKKEITDSNRDYPIVVVSPMRDGQYLLDAEQLQGRLVGLGQVVRIAPDFQVHEMRTILGDRLGAWDGAINILFAPLPGGYIPRTLCRAEELRQSNDESVDTGSRLDMVFEWVTHNTNVPRSRDHIRPEGVVRLAQKRHLHSTHIQPAVTAAARLESQLRETERQVQENITFFDTVAEEHDQLEVTVEELQEEIEMLKYELAQKTFIIESLKEQLQNTTDKDIRDSTLSQCLLLATRAKEPSPVECLDIIENVYKDRCVILSTARSSASEANEFEAGRQLLGQLHKLVSTYLDRLIDGGGDEAARRVFTNNEFAAKESQTVMANPDLKKQRVFIYDEKPVEMFRHLKIGVQDNIRKTLRVHFYPDLVKKKIVIGWCGRHKAISGH